MPILKPLRGSIFFQGHQLARGLVGCWLFNEGSGSKIFDLSGNNNSGSLDNVIWKPGKFGSSTEYDGTNTQVVIPDSPELAFGNGTSDKPFSVLVYAYIKSGSTDTILLSKSPQVTGSLTENLEWILYIPCLRPIFRMYDFNGGHQIYNYADDEVYGDKWHQFVGTYDGSGGQNGILVYVDGIEVPATPASAGTYVAMHDTDSPIRIGRMLPGGSWDSGFDGRIDCVMIWNRVLFASEIAWLAREPFCMFDKGICSELICNPLAIITLEGIAGLQSTAQGSLVSFRRLPELERSWLRDALFNGMTANAFKLGTVLSLGWFWNRVNGCTALYRGSSMENIDFENILAVSEPDSSEISPPTYISHNADSTHFYVVRRFNKCGLQEHTLAASAKVSIKSDASLKERQPNKVFVSRVDQIEGNKIKIIWFYCPLKQESQSFCFKIYYDNASGLIDYENPLTEIEYQGLKFYKYESSALQAGHYLFAVRVESADKIENDSLAQLEIQLVSMNPEPIDILETGNI